MVCMFLERRSKAQSTVGLSREVILQHLKWTDRPFRENEWKAVSGPNGSTYEFEKTLSIQFFFKT